MSICRECDAPMSLRHKTWCSQVVRHEPRDTLAEILHGDTCTCPYSLEDDDRDAADVVMALLASKGYRIVKDAEELPVSPWTDTSDR